jgi:hypothetical protein
MSKSGGIKAVVSAKGISSQSDGAQELPGTYTTRPFPSYVGKSASVEMTPLLGGMGGNDALSDQVGRTKNGGAR